MVTVGVGVKVKVGVIEGIWVDDEVNVGVNVIEGVPLLVQVGVTV
jgi:hypothetical protein